LGKAIPGAQFSNVTTVAMPMRTSAGGVLFGSTARGEARADSDIDLFFDHPLGSLGLFELKDVKEAAARILGRKIDIMTRRSLHPILREQIEASALQVF
jgi:predicted nucleotidyltransferase